MRYGERFWEWQPLLSFGIFRFGIPLRNYKRLRPIYLEEESTIYDSEEDCELNEFAFTLPNHWKTLRVYTDYRKIITSVSSKNFIFSGNNLIGLKAEQICDILERKYDRRDYVEIPEENWYIYFFYDLGLSLWEEDGIITSITASQAYED